MNELEEMKEEIKRDYKIRRVEQASVGGKQDRPQDVDEFIEALAKKKIADFEKYMKYIKANNEKELMHSYKHPFERVNKKLYSSKAQTGERLVKRLRKSVQSRH